MSALRLLFAGVLAAALTVGTAGLSRTPVMLTGSDEAAVRLFWHLEAVAVEDCRQPTPEELAELPVHMRNPRACIGLKAPYLLSVRLDGRVLMADTVRAAGARGDRPLNVLRDLPVTVGEHRLRVDFHALLPEGAVVAEGSVVSLSWAGAVTLESREVALVTLDATGGALEVRRP